MMKKRIVPLVVLLSAMAFSISCAIGYLLETDMRNGTLFVFCASDMVSFLFCYIVLSKMLVLFKENDSLDRKGNFYLFFNKNSFAKVFGMIFILWLPFVVMRYPGIESGGVVFQFQQFMGIDTAARQFSQVIYDGHYISGHHPVLLTCIFGVFIKFGVMIGQPDMGMFLLSCFVCILNASGWAYVISAMRDYLRPKGWVLLFVCFTANPLVISLNTCVLKDNLFATLLAVYCMVILKICMGGALKKYQYGMFFFSILLPFVKNQGIYIVLISNIILMIYVREELKIWLGSLVFALVIFSVLFQNVLCPLIKISPGGRQEMLSIFFQATARTMVEHQHEMDSAELKIIKRILPVEDWDVYDPQNADNIKFQYNQRCTFSDLKDYFIVWIKEGIKYPKSYIKAIAAQTYGYYYSDYETVDWNWNRNGSRLWVSPDGSMISAPKWETLNGSICSFLSKCIHHERYKYLFNVAFSFWVIIMCCLLNKGGKRKLLWIVPVAVQWLICLASPVNGSGRYGLIIYEMAPVIVTFTFAMPKRKECEWDG